MDLDRRFRPGRFAPRRTSPRDRCFPIRSVRPAGTNSASPAPADSTLPSGAGESHTAGQQVHELVEAMRANDAVVGRRIPGARAVPRAVLGEDVVAAALRGRAQQHLGRQRVGRLEVGVGAQRREAGLGSACSQRPRRTRTALRVAAWMRSAVPRPMTAPAADRSTSGAAPAAVRVSLPSTTTMVSMWGKLRDIEFTDEADPAGAHRARPFPGDFSIARKRIGRAEGGPAERGRWRCAVGAVQQQGHGHDRCSFVLRVFICVGAFMRQRAPGLRVAEDGLGLEVLLQAFDAVFASVARALVAAEGRIGAPRRVVDVHLPATDACGHRTRAQRGPGPAHARPGRIRCRWRSPPPRRRCRRR